MKRVTASDARKNWFRLLDEAAKGETIAIERNGNRVILKLDKRTKFPAELQESHSGA